jgi:hypothetical protein
LAITDLIDQGRPSQKCASELYVINARVNKFTGRTTMPYYNQSTIEELIPSAQLAHGYIFPGSRSMPRIDKPPSIAAWFKTAGLSSSYSQHQLTGKYLAIQSEDSAISLAPLT